MGQWTGAGLSVGTTVNSGNVNTAGNATLLSGESVAVGSSGTFTAVIASGGGVDITGASGSVWRLDLSRTAGGFGASRMLYTPKETPSGTQGVSAFRSSAAVSATGAHYATGSPTGRFGFQNAAGADITAAFTTVALVVNHTYQIDQVVVVGTTTSNGRYFYRIKDLTDPTWNTTGDFFYDSGYTANTGTANLTVHRQAKVGTLTLSTGLNVQDMRWAALSTVDTSLTRSVAETHFLNDGTVTAVVATATAAGVAPAVTGGASVTAVVATATATAIAPTVSGGANPNGTVSAVTATATAAAVAPVVSAAATVTGVAATASALAVAPVVTGIRNASVTGVVATATAAGVAPVVSGGSLVTAVAATGTATALAPVVSGVRNATVTAVAATATATALAPTVTAVSGSTVLAVAATATATAVAPVVTGVRNASVTGVAATGTASAMAPLVTAGATVTATVATAEATALAPLVSAHATVSAVPAGAVVAALAPTVTGQAIVTVTVATAVAQAYAPTVSNGIQAEPFTVTLGTPRTASLFTFGTPRAEPISVGTPRGTGLFEVGQVRP